MIVVSCIFGFTLLVATLGWACELHYRRGGVLPPPSTPAPAHPAFTAGIVAAFVACLAGAVPTETQLATAITVAVMALLGWAGRLRAAGLIGVVAIPLLAGVAVAARPPAASVAADAGLHVFTAATFLFALACVVVDVLRAGASVRRETPRARVRR